MKMQILCPNGKKEEPISYTTVREEVLATLKAIGLNSTSFGYIVYVRVERQQLLILVLVID